MTEDFTAPPFIPASERRGFLAGSKLKEALEFPQEFQRFLKDLVLAGFIHPVFFEDQFFLAALRSDNISRSLRRQAIANRQAFRAKHPDEEAPFVDFRIPVDELFKT